MKERIMLSFAWRCRRVGLVVSTIVSGMCFAPPMAEAATFRQGQTAYSREDFASAARIFIPLAKNGDASAQTYLGFMFESGRGVPQNYTEAAYWYRRAAEQGDAAAQYSLGLLYDKGFGVRQDTVEAGKWLNLSTALATKGTRDYRARLRDAVTSKMTRGQIAESRRRAVEWYPQPEPRIYVTDTATGDAHPRLK
jgi:TPR repeat protein